MKFASVILTLFCALEVHAQLPITNNFSLDHVGDSFEFGLYGNRYACYLDTFYLLTYPKYIGRVRDFSRSGANNDDFATDLIPKRGMPEYATCSSNIVIPLLYVSGNGGFDSNSIFGFMQQELKAPAFSYNQSGALTNDWPYSTNGFYPVVIGDVPYAATDARPASRDYSYGGRTAANEVGAPFIDQWTDLSQVVSNNVIGGTNLWFNAPADDHPGNELQLLRALVFLRDIGEDTNTFTAVLDFGNASISATNHCAVSGLTKSGNVLSFTFHADRQTLAYDVADGTITNDCTGAFRLMPQMTNAFFEVLRVTNAPAGNFTIKVDSTVMAAVSSAQLAAGFNLFGQTNGWPFTQGKEVLGETRDMLDVLRTDATTDAHPGDNRLIENYDSFANAVWPTNTGGVTAYTTGPMAAREIELQAQDNLIHAAAQQTNHTFTITFVPPRCAPFHR